MTNAIYYQILQAVATSVTTIVSNTSVRWVPKILESDTLPICLVSPDLQGEMIKNETFANATSGGNQSVWYQYPVLVTYIAAGNQQAGAGLVTFMNTREALRNQLFQTNMGNFLSGVSSVFDIDMNPEAVQALQIALGTNYTATGFALLYTSQETRLS
jgi:hypothetical protein